MEDVELLNLRRKVNEKEREDEIFSTQIRRISEFRCNFVAKFIKHRYNFRLVMPIVGLKIKGIRESKNLSVAEVAERSGLSESQIVSIETDQNLPSLGPLIKIARALGVRLGTFLDDNDSLGPVVCRAADREKEHSISFSNGATDARKHMEYHPLAQQKTGRHMEPFIIDIHPEETPQFQLSAHEGEEFIYVMSGEVEIEYGKETYHLHEGDSIYYDSIVKHHVHGAPGKSAKILALVYIPF